MRLEKYMRVLFGAVLCGILFLAMVPSVAVAVEGEEADALHKFDVEPLDPPRPYRIIEGDIIVTQEWYDNRDSKTCWSSNFWPGMTIPYTFSSNVDAARQATALTAIATWERVCDIDFVPRGSQEDYIRIIADSSSNSSFIGPIGGRQDVKIASWNRITIAHELFHAMGFYHEQSRPDRDTYVQINWDNIETDMDHNFERHDGAGHWWGRYDFNSIMHYSSCAFDVSTCGLPCCTTITVLPPYQAFQSVIGNRAELSHIDSLTAKFMFSNHTDWSFTAVRLCADYGSFANAYTSFGNAFWLMPAGDTLWVLEGPYFEAPAAVYSKETLVHNALEQVTIGPSATRGIQMEINAQIKMSAAAGIEIF
ncbi:MAG: M12 family metallopeptidase [candidate division Zixibacteria bacterium]|nr:M12 family metallopeptidase [candidate division Zixibacteria bacterium]